MEPLANESSMKITDLGFDCLENCFRQLNIEELLNVADSNKRLRHVARYVFSRMYGKKFMYLNCVLKFKEEYRFCLENEIFAISQLKMSLQFLRCFGDLVSRMQVYFVKYNWRHKNILSSDSLRSEFGQTRINEMSQYEKAHEWEHLIIEYINEYCSESLNKIRFTGNQRGDLNKLTKPFVNVEKLEIGILIPTEKKLHELFPRIRDLKLLYKYSPCLIDFSDDREQFLNEKFIANHFPYLEHLFMEVSHWSRYKYNKEYLAIALRLNPQLKSLKGNVWMDVLFNTNNIWNANEHFQNLERLELEVKYDYEKPINENIHLRNLKDLVIDFRRRFFDVEVLCTLPFICDKLESLTFITCDNLFSTFHNLFDKYPTVKKFTLHFLGTNVNFNDFSRLSKSFPLLDEIFIQAGARENDHFTPDGIVRIVKMFHSLKVFKVYLYLNQCVESETIHLVRLLRVWSVSNTVLSESTRLIELKRNE